MDIHAGKIIFLRKQNMCKYSSNKKELEIGSLDISAVSCLI